MVRGESSEKKFYLKDRHFVFQAALKASSVGQTYKIVKRLPPIILAAYKPVNLWFSADVVKNDGNHVLYAPAALRPGTVYSVESQENFVQYHPSGGIEVLDDPLPFLQVSAHLSRRTLKLGTQIVEGINMPFEQALEIERVLSEEYQCTLETAFENDDSKDLE